MQAIKSIAPFYHQRINDSGEQQSIIIVVLLQARSFHCQKARCFRCCWQIDLQANTEVLFFQKVIICLHQSSRPVAWKPGWRKNSFIKIKNKKVWEIYFPHLLLILDLFINYFFPKGCICAKCLTTKRYPGSPAEENQYLNYAVVGQHVWVYKIKWGLKLISNSPWKSLQVFWNETESWSWASEGGSDLRPGIFIIVFVSPN